MREFMDYIQSAFYDATGWSRDNSYSYLNATADALLDFPTPRGIRLTLGSLATPKFATAYQLGTIGVVDGSVSYLYSTVSLKDAVAQSERIPLPDLLRSFKPLSELSRESKGSEAWATEWATIDRNTMAYGRLYLPRSMLEALVVKRFNPRLQMQVSAVSDQTLRNGGTLLGMVQYDEGRYGVEGLASSDGGLLGVRGLYNFGGDVNNLQTPDAVSDESEGWNGGNSNGNGNSEREGIYGRFSTGAELYYGTLNKSGGMSLGARFATLPTHNGTPLTATMTINPLMGNISWTYAVMAGQHCSLATRMAFNVYSYESDWAIGMELWRKKGAWAVGQADDNAPLAPVPVVPTQPPRSFQAKMEWRLDNPVAALDALDAPPTPAVVSIPKRKERSFQAKMEWRLDDPDKDQSSPIQTNDGEYAGVLKARLDQHLKIGLLWEGRIKSLLFSLGSGIDLRRLDSPFRSIGLEVQFSS
ncbi:hypothetical protein BX600DRAFT_515793 [Xylariales sp. PMI_506]|nr:hypothetical protein BX600DRAFT_515793 [Xylariales sp. PMI_506]